MSILSSFLSLAVFAGSLSDTGHRRILLLAPDEEDRDLREQQQILKVDPAGLRDRDILVRTATRKTRAENRGSSAKPPAFKFMLYGKDGGLKFVSDTPVSLYQLYGVIDRMPMRREELRERAGQAPPALPNR